MLTIKEVSHRIGISIALVYREIHAGRLRAHCFGKRAYRVSEDDLTAYFADAKVTADPPVRERQVPKQRDITRFKHLDVNQLLSERR